MDQQHSLIFRVPREIRDEIYFYYFWEKDGYLYDQSCRSLRKANRESVDLALGYTCKTIAQEVRGLALELNTITFRAMLSEPDDLNRESNASLYQKLLDEHKRQHRCMLRWVYSLISADTMKMLRCRYPGNLTVEKMQREVSEGTSGCLASGYIPHYSVLDNFVDDLILLDLVELIAEMPGFEYLTSKEYRWELREVADHYYLLDLTEKDRILNEEELATVYHAAEYSKATQQQILRWRPSHWWVPSRTDLDPVPKYLPDAVGTTGYSFLEHETRTKNYFSATAVTVQFLKSMHPVSFSQLRKIIILEDHPSVALPNIHARGLIPLCRANIKLHVERRVDMWRMELLKDVLDSGRDYYTRYTVQGIATWIHEAKTLRQMGMPPDSYSLVLHGPTREATQQLSTFMVKAAIWEEGSVALSRRTDTKFLYWRDGIAEDFVDVIKEMLRGEIPVRFDVDMEDVWDIDEILSRKGEEWPQKLEELFVLRDFEPPSGGWDAMKREYVEEDDQRVE